MNHVIDESNIRLVQTAINLAVHYGRLDARELIPKNPSTITDRLEVKADEARREILEKVKEAVNDRRVRCTTDMWVDDMNKLNFIDVTAHFSNADCSANESHYLLMAKFPTKQDKTAVNIRNALFREMVTFGFTAEQFSKIEWVTDRGANIKKALEKDSREDCAAHLINTVVQSTLSISYLELRQKAVCENQDAEKIFKKFEEVTRLVKGTKKVSFLLDVIFF